MYSSFMGSTIHTTYMLTSVLYTVEWLYKSLYSVDTVSYTLEYWNW